ncbi:ubiquinone/menaquinone biosynthesis methyltransferase [bacterium]|nr:ubiquinone/menaquinone biosynthesis methyltransferase [bacterium]
MFDGIAGRYDRLNRLLSLGQDRRWRRRAVAELALRTGGRCLDIGCGTGDVALEALRQCPEARVTGIDPSRRMLALAEAKSGGRVRYVVGDALSLPFADGSFAGVVMAFCFRNVADRLLAAREMRRVLAPGGRAVILELTTPEGRLARLGHRVYNRCLVPLAGRLLAGRGGAYQYLADSIEAFPRAGVVAALLHDAGFERVRHTPMTAGAVTLFICEG